MMKQENLVCKSFHQLICIYNEESLNIKTTIWKLSRYLGALRFKNNYEYIFEDL